jgi:hypothetical protein
LGLLPNHRFTPRVEELLARLGSAVTFAEARDLLRLVLGVQVSAASLRQRTYAAGAAALAVARAALARALAAPGTAAAPPDMAQLSVDATKVPLVGGGWTDVKLAAFAEVVSGGPAETGRPAAAAVRLSYVARGEAAGQFGPTISVAPPRRGLDAARVVVSPHDGAAWIQGNLDLVAPQAVRIRDFPHAAEPLGAVAALVYGAGTAAARAWASAPRRALHDGGPTALLAALAVCQARGPCAAAPPGLDGRCPAAARDREVASFATRAAAARLPRVPGARLPDRQRHRRERA